MSFKALVALGLAVFVSGCGLRIPNPQLYTIGCAVEPVAVSSEGQSQSFFMSSALPDCRSGALAMDGFRHPEQTYGSGRYQLIEGDPLSPVLAKHSKEDWIAALRQIVSKPAADGRLVVFIHGYATDFDEAHKDAAKVRALIGENVPLVILHWPSRNRAQDYITDRSSIFWAQDAISNTLAQLTNVADDITLVTHSMGARPGIAAVIALEGKAGVRPEVIRRIALASPDFDRHLALRQGGAIDQMMRHPRKVLIYASQKDRALQAARVVNGYARLGTTSCEYDVIYHLRALGKLGNCHLTAPRDDLAIVDTAPSDPDDFLRHSDFLESCHVREDLKAFLRDEAPPSYRTQITERGLKGFVIDPSINDEETACEPIASD